MTRHALLFALAFFVSAGQLRAESTSAFIARHEGFASVPYPDGNGYSIGYGHQIQPGERIEAVTRSDAARLLAADLARAESVVDRLVKVKLNANQRAALTSFVFNVGSGAFAKSTLLRKVNAGDMDGARGEFGKWVYSGGKRVPALVKRRAEEAEMFGGAK
jgi:lysozyme